MINKSIIFSILLFLATNVHSQKVKYEGENIYYKQYPVKPLFKKYKNYTVTHTGFVFKQIPNDPKFHNENQEKSKSFKLTSYNKVKQGEDFRINVYYSIFVDSKTERVEGGYKNNYYLTLHIYADLLDTNNTLIDTIQIRKIDNEFYQSTGPFINNETALSNLTAPLNSIKPDVYKKYSWETEQSINEKLSILTYKLKFESGFIKDDTELTNSSVIFNSVVVAIDTIRFDGKDKIKNEEISKCISTWEKGVNNLGEANNKNEDIQVMYNYNLSRAYFLLSNYDKSKEYMARVMKIYNTYSAVKQLSWLHIYKFNDLLTNLDLRLKANDLK